MGGAIGVSMNYGAQRRALRHKLIMQVINDPTNKDILSNISALRKILIENHEICATAAHELANKFDHSATSTDAAYRELDRLFTVYETSRILKSAKMRAGPAACPLGHHMSPFESMEEYPGHVDPTKRITPICNVCEKKTKSGFHCSYCQYNLCKMCSTIYCTYGHEMQLWTAGESDCSCVVCHKHPVYSGYRCTKCPDYDICDFCTYKDGRAAIAATIMVRMEDNLGYMRKHAHESYTANHTITTLKVTVGAGENSFATIWHLVQFSNELQALRNTSVFEVIQYRTSMEIMRLREILIKHVDLNATAAREQRVQQLHPQPTALIADTFFTKMEASRLHALADAHTKAKSKLVRDKADAACPLGHVAKQFDVIPARYMMYGLEQGIRDERTTFPPMCRNCDRRATAGYHCSFCEYDLCKICKVMYCSEGHEMLMWTIPEAQGQRCYVCSKPELTQGYHCTKCFVNLCDMCTRKERRLDVRAKWDQELDELMTFMHDSRHKSDLAKYYNWRTHTQIISLGVLCDLVRELRLAKYKAEKQIKFKLLIDKMKVIRADLAVNQDMSKLAAREAARNTGPDGYVFKTKRFAKNELRRLHSIIARDIHCRMGERRGRAGIACPLGHAMAKLRDKRDRPVVVKAKKVMKQVEDGKASLADAFASAFEDLNNDPDEEENEEKEDGGSPGKKAGPIDTDLMLPEDNPDIDQALGPNGEVDVHWRDTFDGLCDCKVCGLNCREGWTCPMCEYDLCQDCSKVYCRQGHEMQIWTLPEAVDCVCDVCMRTKITAGYRCMDCKMDICDRCTSQEPRQGMKIWPRREIRKLITYHEALKADSMVSMEMVKKATEYLAQEFTHSMSAICRVLNELREGKDMATVEVQEKRAKFVKKQYALTTTDF